MGLEEKLPRIYSCVHTPGLPESRCNMCNSYLIGGGSSGFNRVGPGNISRDQEFDDLTDSKIDTTLVLSERYDLSGHDDMKPHLNQSIDFTDKFTNSGKRKTLYDGVLSNKNEDGYKGLGKAHSMLLFPEDE